MNSLSFIRDQSCPNKMCPHYGLANAGNIRVNSLQKKRLRCSLCNKTWAAYRHEKYFGIRLSHEKFGEFLLLMKQGKSVRKIAQLMQVSPSTIQRWKRRSMSYVS